MATDSTQFLIEMAAKLTGGKAAVTDLQALGDRMLAAGATADDLEKVIKQTSSSLDAAKLAVSAAGEALSAGEQRYAGMETAAERAAKSVERLSQRVEDQRAKLAAASDAGNDRAAERAAAKLAQLVERQGEAAEKSSAAAAALKVEAVSLDAVKSKAAAAEKTHADLSKGLANVKSAAEKAKKAEDAANGSGSMRELASGLRRIGGPAGEAGNALAELGEGFEKVMGSIGAAGPYIAIAVALVAVASAATAATVAITKWGVSLADTNRTQGLLYDGIARSSEGGAKLADTIDRLGTIVPMTNDELTQMASQLANTGLRGQNLTSALERSAVAAAKLKFGPDFAAQFLSLDFQAKKFHDNIAATFGGLKIDNLLEGIQTLGALFDAGTESGAALKFLFESLFQPIVDGATSATVKVERFFLYGEILALKAYIALKPYRSEIEAVGEALLIGAGVLIGVFAAAVLLVVGALTAAVAVIGLVAYGLYLMGEAIVTSVTAAWDWLVETVSEFTAIGGQIIDGLVSGITDGAAAVVKAITGVVSDGINAAKHLLGIASPSAVFAGIGDMTVAGFTGGVERGTDDAQSSLEALVAPPRGGAAGGGSRGDVVINISIDGHGKDNEGLAQLVADAVRDVFESDALQLGAGETAAVNA